MSTSETTMIGACAKCGRAIPACICRPAPTSAPLIEAPAQPEPRTPDAPCELCNGPTFGDPGGEGHGLGECVECCPTCKGSGHLGPFTDRPRTPDETLAAWDEMRAELLDAESDSPTMVDLVAVVDDMAKRLRELEGEKARLESAIAADAALREKLCAAEEGLRFRSEMLAWALCELKEAASQSDSNGVPSHACEYHTNPEKGACDWHDHWVAAASLAGMLDTQQQPTEGTDG